MSLADPLVTLTQYPFFCDRSDRSRLQYAMGTLNLISISAEIRIASKRA